MPSCTHCISHFDLASDLDSVVICVGVDVLVFKLSAYFTLNKEHLNPRFVHELADKLVVRQCHGQGVIYEEEEDSSDYGLHKSWHKQRSKLLHTINEEQITMATKSYPSNKWYEEPSILYEEQVNNHGVPMISNLSVVDHSILTNAPNTSYLHTILPMASQKVAKKSSHKVVAMVMSTPSTVMVFYGSTPGARNVVVTQIVACALDSKEYCNCRWVWLI